jgi:hypothetical protein
MRTRAIIRWLTSFGILTAYTAWLVIADGQRMEMRAHAMAPTPTAIHVSMKASPFHVRLWRRLTMRARLAMPLPSFPFQPHVS